MIGEDGDRIKREGTGKKKKGDKGKGRVDKGQEDSAFGFKL